MSKKPLDSLLDEAKLLADDRPVEAGHLPQWTLDAEHMIRRLVKAFSTSPQPAQQEPALQPAGLSDAVYTVLEGFTLPHDVRKILETAFYGPASTPQPAQQEPVIDHSCKDEFELIMKWADIYAAQTGCLYSEAAQDPSKASRMADERTILARVVAQTLTQPAQQDTADTKRLDWLNNNFFNRENLDWLTGNVSKDSLMWVFFAPTKVQGNIRDVLDAAINRDNNIKGATMTCPHCYGTGYDASSYPCTCQPDNYTYATRVTIKPLPTKQVSTMKFTVNSIILLIVAELACLSSIAGAVFLAYHGKEGWCWFIFLALLTAVSYKKLSSEKSE